MNPVAITGLAIESPFGNTPDAFWKGICFGPTPVSPWSCAALGAESFTAAVLPGPRSRLALPNRIEALCTGLVERALAQAGFPAVPCGSGFALGSLFAESDYYQRPRPPPPRGLLAALAQQLAFTGPVVNTPIGCAAGNLSLAFALEQLAAGRAPLMVAGGFDLIGPAAIMGFNLFGNLTETVPRPFAADRDGFLIAEGGAMFVLEPLDAARRRGARILATLCAAACAHDASHPTRPAPDGRGLARAIRQALSEAGLKAAQVGYVNAHSPGTRANDEGEAQAYRDIFGPRGVPVSSTKGALGHAQGGANALEAAACILALEHQLLPPTLNTLAAEERFGLDLILGAPRAAALTHVLSSASGMGGASAVVLFGRAP